MVDNIMSKEIFRELKNNMNQFAQIPLPYNRFFNIDTCHYWCFKGYEVINNYLQVLWASFEITIFTSSTVFQR